jgi:hypothetical protein
MRATLCLGIFAVLLIAATRPADIPFQKHTLDHGANEACAFADVNGDGKLDIISGENWYAAPKWSKRRFRDLHFENNYIDDFSDLPLDVDGDGRVDIVSASWFSRKIVWYKNPGKGEGMWAEYPVESGFNTEFAFLVDMDNDGKAREILPQFGGANGITAWYEFREGKWHRRQVSDKGYGHGIGAGDLSGDGRTDILTPQGWFEAPADPRAGEWKWHPDWKAEKHLGFLHVLDPDGDGRPDIVTSHAHDFGVFWMRRDSSGNWARYTIDDSWSQAHAVTIVDLNGDGRKDILTGKRWLAHDHDPGAQEPLGIYWYESMPAPRPNPKTGPLQWIRHVIDFSSRAGGGMQMPAADLDGDGDIDFAAPGKSGLFLFENKTR